MSPAWGTLRFPYVFVFLLKLTGSAPSRLVEKRCSIPADRACRCPGNRRVGGRSEFGHFQNFFSIGQTPDHLDLAGIASFEGMRLYSTLRPWSAGTVDGFCRSSKAKSVRGSAGGSGAVEGLLR